MSSHDASVFVNLVDLSPGSSPDAWIGPPAPERGGATYGGQFLAQSIAAGYRTVDDDRFVNAIHGLFLRGGDVDAQTEWSVDRVREGRSFATRQIVGHQRGKEVFQATLSFHVPEDGFVYRPEPDFAIDELPAPEDVPLTYVEFCKAHPDTEPDWHGQDRPMDIRYIDAPDPVSGPPITAPQRTWTRVVGSLPDDPRIHHAALAYQSDATLIDHAMLPHGHRWQDGRLTGVSLDHSMWFYGDVRADEWLLLDQRVEITGGARGLTTGRFYTAAGELVSTCTQEGLIRWAG